MFSELIPALPWSFLFIQDLIGTIVFAISGAIAARQHKMDIFGMFILAFVTGVGGGTLRDMMIGSTPVFWMKQPIYVLMITLAVVITAIFRNQISRKSWQTGLLVFDAIGLGVFTVIGVQKGLDFGLHPLICVALGGVTGCFGGLIRDIFTQRSADHFAKRSVCDRQPYRWCDFCGCKLSWARKRLGLPCHRVHRNYYPPAGNTL